MRYGFSSFPFFFLLGPRIDLSRCQPLGGRTIRRPPDIGYCPDLTRLVGRDLAPWWKSRPGSWSLVLSGSTAMVEPTPLHCRLPMKTPRGLHQRTVLPARHIKVPTTPDVRPPGPHTGQPAPLIIEGNRENAHGAVHFLGFFFACQNDPGTLLVVRVRRCGPEIW